MNYEKYEVRVYTDGDKYWYQEGKLHRTDGPAVEFANGTKLWYIEGKEYTKKEFIELLKNDCDGKTVEIDGKKYKLILQ